MRTTRRAGLALGLAALLMSAQALAQEPKSGCPSVGGAGEQAAATVPQALQQDMQQLHAPNLAQIQLAKKAQQKAESQTVKELARSVEQRHAQNEAQLRELAQKNNVNLEGDAFRQEQMKFQQRAQSLEPLSGPAFDQAYTQLVVQNSQQDIEAIRQSLKEAEAANQPQISAFLENTCSALHQNYEMASRAQAQERGVGGAGAQAAPVPQSLQQDMQQLHATNVAAIDLAKKAQQKAQSQTVKDLARSVEQQHVQNDAQLRELAKTSNVNLEGEAFKQEQKMLQQRAQNLEPLTGAAFDQAYTQAMVQNYPRDIESIRQSLKEAEAANQAQISTYLENTCSALHQNYQMANLARAEEQRGVGGAGEQPEQPCPGMEDGTGGSGMTPDSAPQKGDP